MGKVLAISEAVVADAIRSKVVWVVVVFSALLALVIPSLPSDGVGVAVGLFREVAVSLMFAAAYVVAVALAATRIPTEVERRTVFNVLVRDVRRWQYLVGTWFGMVVVLSLSLLGLTTVAIVVGGFTYKAVMWGLLGAAFAVLLEMGTISAFTLMMSTRFGTVTSIVGAIAFTFIGHSVGVLFLGSASASGSVPWYVPSLEIFNVIDAVSYGNGYGLTYALAMLAAFSAWSALLLWISSILFAGRDL